MKANGFLVVLRLYYLVVLLEFTILLPTTVAASGTLNPSTTTVKFSGNYNISIQHGIIGLLGADQCPATASYNSGGVSIPQGSLSGSSIAGSASSATIACSYTDPSGAKFTESIPIDLTVYKCAPDGVNEKCHLRATTKVTCPSIPLQPSAPTGWQMSPNGNAPTMGNASLGFNSLGGNTVACAYQLNQANNFTIMATRPCSAALSGTAGTVTSITSSYVICTEQ